MKTEKEASLLIERLVVKFGCTGDISSGRIFQIRAKALKTSEGVSPKGI